MVPALVVSISGNQQISLAPSPLPQRFPLYNSARAEMPHFNKYRLLLATALLSSLARADCLPFDEARKHVGEVKCITGKVVRVKQGSRGVHFLDFCDDFRLCTFTVVVFPGDLKSVG